MTMTDRINGVLSTLAVKAPVRAATFANIDRKGLQTIDGVNLVDGDRVLVRFQTDSRENGIFVVRTSSWERAPDFDGARDAVRGTMLYVTDGLVYGGTYWKVSNIGSFAIGTDPIYFDPALSANEVGTNIIDFGPVGIDRETDSATFQAAADSGRAVRIPNGTYYAANVDMTTPGTYFVGESREGVVFESEITGDEWVFRIMASHCGLQSMGGPVNQTTPIGVGQGQRGTFVTVGEGYYDGEVPDLIENVLIDDVHGYREPGSYQDSNMICVIGRIRNVHGGNLKLEDSLCGLICHWGGDQSGPGAAITQSYHPNDVYFEGIELVNCQYGVLTSACYNAHFRNVSGMDCDRAFRNIAGDVGNTYASAEEKPLIGSNVTFRDAVFHGITVAGAIDFDGEGKYPDVDDYRRISMYNTLVENVTLHTVGAISPVAIVQDTFGPVIRGLRIVTDESDCLGIEVVRSTATVEKYTTNAKHPIQVDRASCVLADYDFSDPAATSITDTNMAIEITGQVYASTLGANVISGATSITLGSSFPIRAYKGDVIRVTGTNNYAIIAQDYLSISGTAVQVEAVDWAASNGAAVFLDKRVSLDLVRGRIKGYPTAVYARNSVAEHVQRLHVHGLNTLHTGNRDFDLQNIADLKIIGCTTEEGGLRFFADATATRSIALQTIGRAEIRGNYIGKGAKHLQYGIVFADDQCTNGVYVDNMFGDGIAVSEVSGTDVSAANIAAGKANIFDNNRVDSGGQVSVSLTNIKSFSGNYVFSHATGVTTNNITERTAAAGVTIDGMLVKDGGITLANGNTVLNWYETGVWTPVPYGGTTPGSPAGTFTGNFTRIGRMLFFDATLIFTGLSTMAGQLRIDGLPYACVNRAFAGASFRNNFTNDFGINGQIVNNTNDIYMYRSDQDAVSLAITDLSATTQIYISGCCTV